MLPAAQDLLGEAALAANPRAIAAGPRARVAFRGAPGADALLPWLGAGARIEPATPAGEPGAARGGWMAEFAPGDAPGDGADAPPLARALLAAARARAVAPAAPRILGIVNVTPDSFSDGGSFEDPARAIEHGLRLVAEGAHALDVGGESTRPGATPVDLDVELRRVLPVLRGLAAATRAPLCVDTTKARVAAEALDAGATLVNDVSAGRFDPEMLPLVARRGCELVLMHMLGTPRDMQRAPAYGDVVDEVLDFLRRRAAACRSVGIEPERLWIDPGIGFGKRLEHNLELFARLAELRSLGIRLAVGPSRKAFVDHVRRAHGASASEPRERLGGTAAAVAACVLAGAELVRVHDVRMMAEAAQVARAIAER